MTEKEFLAHKIPILMKEGYNKSQAAAISYSMYNKQKAQQGTVVDSAQKMFQANIGDTGISSKHSNYGSEIINPITLVQKVGDEGYNVFYGDPNDPNADKVFFTADEFNQKKNFKAYPNNPSYNREPYLQTYLSKTQGRVGIPVKYQQGGMSKAEQFLGNNYAIQTAYEEVPKGTEAQAMLAMEQFSKAPQKKIQRILPNVQTFEPKQGLPEGTYTRVDYADNTFDYLTPSGYENLRRMNNYRLFMEGQKRQQGGEYYAQMGMMVPQPYALNTLLQNQAMSQQQDFSQGQYVLPPTPTFNTRDDSNLNFSIDGQQPYQPTQEDIIKQGQQITETTLPTNVQTAEAQKAIQQDNIKYNDVNRVNILNPGGGISLDYALNYAGRGFGTGNPWQAGIGTGLSLLKGTRNFLTGFSEGKETKRVAQEMMDNQFDRPRNYIWAQQGGKIKNSEVIAQNAITDNPQGNINLENNEYVLRTDGQVQPVVGEPHIKNGKIAEGVNAQLNEGDKVLSDYVKLKPTDIKELKERYNVSLKKGATFADAQKKLDQKLGIKKLEDEKAVLLEKSEKAATILDGNSRELSLNALAKSIGTVNEKINTLSGVREDNFNFLFERQEAQEKKGDGTQLFDKNGKEVTEVAQEGKEEEYYQEGGMYIQQLAKKHNIPLERAMELIKMQEGGEQEQVIPQEQEQAQMQMFQMIAEALQQGATPDEIITSLIQQGLPHEQVMNAVEQVVMQMQGAPQPQEVAQQGRIGSRYEDPALFKKQTATGEGWESFGELLKEKPQEVLAEIKRVHPELYSTYFKGDKVNKGNIAEFQKAVNKKYENILEDAEKVYGKDSERLTQLKNQIEQDKFTDITPEYSERVDGNVNTNIRGLDAMLGNYTSTRPNFVLDVLPKEDLKKVNEAGVNTASELKTKFPDLYKQYVGDKKLTSDFWLGEIQPEKEGVPTPQQKTVEQQTQPIIQTRDRVKNVMPNFEPYIPMFSALQPIAKQNVDFQRITPIKQTVEPMLAEQARQYQTEVDRIEQAGMSPQQQEAILAQGLAAGQMAANDAISRVETFNAQNQFQTDQYNAGLQAKEQIMNAQMNDAYQDKMMASLANQEESIRNQYRTQFLQGQADRNYITNLNKINTLSDQFAVTPDGVEYLNNQSYSVPTNIALNTQLEDMTPEQREIYKAQEIAKKRQTYAQMGLKR